jgi:hypothetical protein
VVAHSYSVVPLLGTAALTPILQEVAALIVPLLAVAALIPILQGMAGQTLTL